MNLYSLLFLNRFFTTIKKSEIQKIPSKLTSIFLPVLEGSLLWYLKKNSYCQKKLWSWLPIRSRFDLSKTIPIPYGPLLFQKCKYPRGPLLVLCSTQENSEHMKLNLRYFDLILQILSFCLWLERRLQRSLMLGRLSLLTARRREDSRRLTER